MVRKRFSRKKSDGNSTKETDSLESNIRIMINIKDLYQVLTIGFCINKGKPNGR